MNKQTIDVNGSRMAYVETGTGDPIVFLHGNPSSSHLWRNIMPYAESSGRCIAPDLIGMGESDRLMPNDSGTDRCTFAEHREYLDEFLRLKNVEQNVILVIHDWGSALGFDWAKRNPEKIRGICFMEAFMLPWQMETMPENLQEFFSMLRGPEGEDLCLQENFFLEQVLLGNPEHIKITDADREIYRRGYEEPGESRRATLTWPKEVPIDGEPAGNHQIFLDYSNWLLDTVFPKLMIVADPGAILVGESLAHARKFQNQTEVTVPGWHFVQEQSPDEIGEALQQWLADLSTNPSS